MGKEGRVRATAASQYCAVPFHSAHSFHRKQDRPPVTCLHNTTLQRGRSRFSVEQWPLTTVSYLRSHTWPWNPGPASVLERGVAAAMADVLQEPPSLLIFFLPPLPLALARPSATLARQHGRGRGPIHPQLTDGCKLFPLLIPVGQQNPGLSCNPSFVPPFSDPSSRHHHIPPA